MTASLKRRLAVTASLPCSMACGAACSSLLCSRASRVCGYFIVAYFEELQCGLFIVALLECLQSLRLPHRCLLRGVAVRFVHRCLARVPPEFAETSSLPTLKGCGAACSSLPCSRASERKRHIVFAVAACILASSGHATGKSSRP